MLATLWALGVTVATVDLSEKWENIEARLLELVNQVALVFSEAT